MNKIRLSLDLDIYGDDTRDAFLLDEDKLTVEELIPRILLERKLFIDVTEESLLEEIAAAEAAGVSEADNAADNGIQITVSGETPISKTESEVGDTHGLSTNTGDSKIDVFNKNRTDLAKNVALALNETSLSLDFVSLLIASVKQNIGKSTMSPHLLKNIPLGSLSSDKLANEDINENNSYGQKKEESGYTPKIGQGWKFEAVSKITQLFKNASVKLKEQVEKEEHYWKMINVVLANDEVLFKHGKSIGVKYGYGDAGSIYHDKGLAILRSDENTGYITFTPVASLLNFRVANKMYKYIQVKILNKIDEEFMVTGISSFKKTFTDSQFQVVNDLEKARYFLFEEDLFYFLTREAKTLINYNVSIISNKIIFEINDEIIEIEAVPFDEYNNMDIDLYQNINSYSSMHNDKCESILNYLKTMLCCFYKYNLSLKQKMPTLFTKWKQQNSHPLILRPLLGNIRHEIYVTVIKKMLEELLLEFKDQLEADLKLQKLINLKTFTGNIFQRSVQKPVSEIVMTLENKQGKCMRINTELTTNEIFVPYVINLTIVKYASESNMKGDIEGTNCLQLTVNNFEDVKESLQWSILNFVNV